MNVSITVDSKALTKSLNSLQRSQIPFSTARAINRIMQTAQTEQLDEMRKTFTIRRDTYLKRSVKITKFAKKLSPTGTIALVGQGGTLPSTFQKFEAGGSVTGPNGKRKAIPSNHVQPNKSKVIPIGKRPANLKNKFAIDNELFQRVGKGKNERVELAYTLKNTVRVRPVLKFVDRISRIIVRDWSDVMTQELAQAIATMK